MTTTHHLQLDDREFDVVVTGRAWQPCDALTAVDATLELEVRPRASTRPIMLFVGHGHFTRPRVTESFIAPISNVDLRALIRQFDAAWRDRESNGMFKTDRGRVREADLQYALGEGRFRHTHAPRHPGSARLFLDAELKLGSADWMQDWPLEVSDSTRLREFREFYDQHDDPLSRFDTMQLALFSLEETWPCDPATRKWFEQTLQRDFALHGHTVAYYPYRRALPCASTVDLWARYPA